MFSIKTGKFVKHFGVRQHVGSFHLRLKKRLSEIIIVLVTLFALIKVVPVKNNDTLSSDSRVTVHSTRAHYEKLLTSIGNIPSIDDLLQVSEDWDPCNLVLPGRPECESQTCLWSHSLQKNIDMTFKPLHYTHGKSCLFPFRGQRVNPVEQAGNSVSYIITFQNSMPILLTCILKIFLDARYTDGAELILVQDGPGSPEGIKELGAALHLAFGFNYKYIVNPDNLGKPAFRKIDCV